MDKDMPPPQPARKSFSNIIKCRAHVFSGIAHTHSETTYQYGTPFPARHKSPGLEEVPRHSLFQLHASGNNENLFSPRTLSMRSVDLSSIPAGNIRHTHHIVPNTNAGPQTRKRNKGLTTDLPWSETPHAFNTEMSKTRSG